MPLEDLDTFDMVLQPDPEGRVALVITDTGLTTDPQARVGLLRQKVSNYFGAVVAGHFKEQFPKLKTSNFYIKVVAFTAPTPEMFEITQLKSRSNPEHRMEVVYEQPDGRLWPGAKMSIPEQPRDLEPPSAALNKLANEALEFGFETILDKNFIMFAQWLQGGEKHVACIPGDAAAALDAGIRMAAELPAMATQFVLVYDAFITRDGAQQDALLARACERDRARGLLFALEYKPAKWPRKAKRIREPYVLDECENDLEFGRRSK
jgi:hypothetical protein